jgi:hypothetical protein
VGIFDTVKSSVEKVKVSVEAAADLGAVALQKVNALLDEYKRAVTGDPTCESTARFILQNISLDTCGRFGVLACTTSLTKSWRGPRAWLEWQDGSILENSAASGGCHRAGL